MPQLLGSDANQLPTNGDLGTLAFQNSNALVIQPSATATPQQPGDLVFELTSNTSLTLKAKGSDGTVRSVILTLT